MRAGMIVIVLLLAGCASPSDRGATPHRPASRGIDTLCMDDCLGAGGNKDFCEDRCTY
ncbi:MAG TPA: hypothetical protein VFI80_02745 [Burkholderiales bacterium]|nr:hypothetical protein [Burkholderiales bacterium]